MNKFILTVVIFLLSLPVVVGNVFVIPIPEKITEYGGELIFKQVVIQTSGFENTPVELIKLTNGILNAHDNPSKKKQSLRTNLMLVLDSSSDIGEEGYVLSTKQDGIIIRAKTEAGLFYALQTLTQLVSYSEDKQYLKLPLLDIEDAPRFGYRGLSLDVCRHFFPVSFVKNYIDLMSRYKLNTLHWHLTDDQGWRIEIKKYPELTGIGAYRDQTLIGHRRTEPRVYDGTTYGGFYTQEQIREVVAYAASKHITIIPEIEMPGHALAALASYPELGCGDNPGPYKVAQLWGVFHDVFCAGKESTFQFIQNVLDEVLELFPSEYIHIGGDECPKTKWEACSFCQARIKEQGLMDEDELQSYFIRRIEKYLNQKGRQIIGWDEILAGGLAPKATVMSWQGITGGIEAAYQKHSVIMAPNSFLYFDYRESRSDEEPLTTGGYIPLEKAYHFDPLARGLKPEFHQYIKGVQANIWTEYLKTPEKIYYMLIPRLFALSEVAWSVQENKNWIDFSEKRLPVHLAEIDRQGINFRVPVPIGAKDTIMHAGEFELNLKYPVAGADIFYTLDGHKPTIMDYKYAGKVKFIIPEGEERIVKFIVVTPSGKQSITTTMVIKNN